MDPALALEAAEVARYRVIDDEIARGDSHVQRFYSGAVVMVTGGSGFLGKQLIEKLLRSCDITKIYMLLRTKRGKSAQQRLEKFLRDPVFDKLHIIKPDSVTKIVPVIGDITKIGLGICKEDWTAITDEVTVIFHGAATISFTEPIKLATLTNVRGTCEMLTLGKACRKLRAYMHISTAYTHATHELIKQTVKEKFYQSPISPTVLIQMVENFDSETLDKMTPHLIKNWPNTYSYTKAVAEEAVRTMGADLPICIVRPAVVISSLREPTPGWIEPSCIFGPTGVSSWETILFGVGVGTLHTMYLDTSVHLDFVPVDIVNNATIVAALETYQRKSNGATDIKIYTVTGSRNPINFGDAITIFKRCNMATDRAIWNNFGIATKFKPLFLVIHWLLHLIPAYLGDLVLRILGKTPKCVKLCNLLTKFVNVYEYYTMNEWTFDDKNLQELYQNLSSSDRLIFNCNSVFEWKPYLIFWGIGTRKYILKDGLKNTDLGNRKQKWFALANWIVLPMYFYILWRILYGVIFVIASVLGFFKF